MPVGCRTLAGSPCSSVGASAAAATRTAPRATAASIASTMIELAGREPSVPKLIVIASAPLSTAQAIERATEESDRSLLAMSRPQPKPAPAMPIASSAAAHASDATCVPWPTSSTVAGPLPRVSSKSADARMRGPRSGWLASTPESMTATSADSPREKSHAASKPWRRRYHCAWRPSLARGSGVEMPGSLGA